MFKAFNKLHRPHLTERGATMVEYGLMVALIAVIVALAVGPLGLAISTFFDGVASSL